MPRCVNELCLLLGYSRQAYYQGIKSFQEKEFEAEIIIAEVLRIRKTQKHIGTRKLLHKMHAFLASHGFKIGRDSMFNLLAERRLLVKQRRRSSTITTFSRHRYRMFPNIIRDFIPMAPNKLWVSDITYIRLKTGFAYLSLITDAYSRKIVGYCLCKDLSAEGPLKALRMALRHNANKEGLIHHSDRGVQYCCDAYVKILHDNNIGISMTENGDPLENAIAERVNGILKRELLEQEYNTFEQAYRAVAKACSIYNNDRPHGSVNYLCPSEAHLVDGKLERKWKNYYPKKQQKEILIV
jgi:transposase InsO family protein